MRVKLTATVLLLFALCGCNRISSPLEAPPPRQVTLSIVADGESRSLTTAAATVSEALAEAQIHLGALDRVEPGEYLAVEEGMVVTVVRVIEQFHSVEVELLYGQQIVRNEGLPEGERRLLQAGRGWRRSSTASSTTTAWRWIDAWCAARWWSRPWTKS